MLSYRYSRWDDTQQVFGPDQEQVMDELANDLLAHGDVWRALRELFQRGMQGQQGQRLEGLRELMERLRALRQQQLQRYNLDSLLEDLKQRLEQVKETEQKGIDRRVGEARGRARQEGKDAATDPLLKMLEGRAQKSKEFLEGLPESLGGAIKELSSYEFMDPEAQRQFQELLDMLKGRMLENYMKNLRQALQGMDPQQMAALREMLRALNKMLQEKLRGGQPDFDGFMQQFGQFFGPNPPRSLEEMLERLQHQIAQAQ